MEGIVETTTRLAAGSTGRTEADIQSDVRKFLLDAPLDLDQGELVDIALEAQAGGGRRIDVEAGCAAIEVKKSLRSPSVLAEAVNQLAAYVKQRTEERKQRYVGILTDGKLWVLFHRQPDDTLAEVQRLTLAGGEDAPRLASWLESVLATTEQIRPSPREVERRLGALSPATQLDLADLRSLYAASRRNPEVQLKRELWARLLVAALGTNFEDSDELFVTHTYLVLTAELLAHAVMGIPIDAFEEDVRALLEGHQFDLAGLHGVVEADFFDWPAAVPAGAPIIRGIARRLATFDWSEVDHDVLKTLYESVIDTETRRDLGEYYTPDWLADKMVAETYTDPLHQRMLDPACGSGTFLFWAIRRLIGACEDAGLENRAIVAEVVDRVHGMDLHPVAVTLARVTYLLALTPERLADRDELTVPVYLGDSVRWEQDDTLLSQGGITVRTSDNLEFFEQELHFPEGVVEEPARFDRLVETLARRAADRPHGSQPPGIAGIMNAHKVGAEVDRKSVETVFAKLCRLHDAGRDHLWSYYIRNLARPLAFTRPEGRVDVLVGNPPWLAYRHMPEKLQSTYQALAKQRGLWAGGKVATHQDLSDLFVVRSVEQYLKTGGRFAFVMPYAVLSRRQYAGFRSGNWSGKTGDAVLAHLAHPEEFARVKPPLFPVPSCVIRGEKGPSAKRLPGSVLTWTGRVVGHHTDWATASAKLDSAVGDVTTAADSGESPYRRRFRQGATLVPRMLVTVRPGQTTALGLSAGRVAVESARSAIEKPPWRDLPSLAGSVEEQFVRPMHMGATIVAYRAREAERAVVPWVDGDLLDGQHERLDEFPGLAAWWREAERTWERSKSPSTRLSLRDQVDFQGKLQRQLPVAQHRVVYTGTGQHLAACRIEDAVAVISHTLYWAPAETVEEARYLSAVLNSDALTGAVAPLQARGQHNPRHFDMHVFALPFPIFDGDDKIHQALAELASIAEEVAAAVDLDPRWQFQKARRVTREALRDHGVASQVDAMVDELLAESTAVAPLLPAEVAAV